MKYIVVVLISLMSEAVASTWEYKEEVDKNNAGEVVRHTVASPVSTGRYDEPVQSRIILSCHDEQLQFGVNLQTFSERMAIPRSGFWADFSFDNDLSRVHFERADSSAKTMLMISPDVFKHEKSVPQLVLGLEGADQVALILNPNSSWQVPVYLDYSMAGFAAAYRQLPGKCQQEPAGQYVAPAASHSKAIAGASQRQVKRINGKASPARVMRPMENIGVKARYIVPRSSPMPHGAINGAIHE